MTIRTMSIKDYEAVYALWMSCKGMGLNDLDDSKSGIDKFLRRNPTTCLVADTGRSLVGVILAGHDGRRGYIYHTAVQPEYRKQGIASRLVSAAVSELKREGINKIALLVFSHNSAGNEFWEKCGFTLREDVVYRNKAIAELIRIDT